MVTLQITEPHGYNCPEPASKGYQFLDQCRVTSCKNYCSRVKSGCLQIERDAIIDNCSITLEELSYYRKTDLEALTTQAKTDNISVQSLVAFDKFYHWSAAQKPHIKIPKNKPMPGWGTWLANYPYNLGIWETNFQSLANMFKPEVFDAWKSNATTAGRLNHQQVLHVRRGQHRNIFAELFPHTHCTV